MTSRFDMTWNEARKIQQDQCIFYGPSYPGGAVLLQDAMDLLTTTVTNPDEKLSIQEINRLVPRGIEIENLIYSNKHRVIMEPPVL